MQIRAVPGSSVQLLGDITDVDSRSHEVQVEFPHERVDSYKTTFGPDCFRQGFTEQLPIMVWAHDLRDPIGRSVRAQVLPKHNEVIGRFSDLEAVPSARRAFSQIDDGTITDFSFGYVDGHERPHPDPQLRRRGVRQIPRARMREISPVSIGSIPGAKVAGLREDGNLVTVDSPETVAKLVEFKVISPAEGNALLRSFGVLDGVRDDGWMSAGSGPGWTAQQAAAHLQEAHGLNVYQAGMGAESPQTLAITHAQLGSATAHDHGMFQGWLVAIAQSLAAARANGTMLTQTPESGAQEDKVDQVGGIGYQVAGGMVGGPGDASKAVPPLATQFAAAVGYPVAGAPMAGRAGPAPYVGTTNATVGTLFFRDGDYGGGGAAGNGAGTDAQMHARAAQDSAAEAMGAVNGGNRQLAEHKARNARIHARAAREQARPDDQGDMRAVAAADGAAKQASDAADASTFDEPAGAGAWNEQPVRADQVLALVERHDPGMWIKLREAKLALAPPDVDILFRDAEGSVTDGDGAVVAFDAGNPPAGSEAAALALNVDAALDNARQWLDGADIAALPDEVRQALALVSAAADGSDALVAALGGSRAAADSEDADEEMSETPWDEFSEGDYTPEQYRAAALIDKGTGAADSKARYALPVREPSGKLNKHGIAAAATRIGQVDASDSEKTKAARALMGMYGKMKKPTPPNVLKVLGQGERADAAQAEAELEEARQLLEGRLAKRA